MTSPLDLTGLRFGNLVAIRPVGNNKNNQVIWECECDCGALHRTIAGHLRSGHTTRCRSCAYSAAAKKTAQKLVKDISGERFGRLTVVRRSGSSDSGNATWECRCDCGEIVERIGTNLRSGGTQSCGCWQREVIGQMNRLPEGEASFNVLYRQYQQSAEDRDLSWELSCDQFRRLISLPCQYCGLAPAQSRKSYNGNGVYIYNGVDRVDNHHGYCVENCVPCCMRCNYSKSDLSMEEWADWIRRLSLHMSKRLFCQQKQRPG